MLLACLAVAVAAMPALCRHFYDYLSSIKKGSSTLDVLLGAGKTTCTLAIMLKLQSRSGVCRKIINDEIAKCDVKSGHSYDPDSNKVYESIMTEIN